MPPGASLWDGREAESHRFIICAHKRRLHGEALRVQPWRRRKRDLASRAASDRPSNNLSRSATVLLHAVASVTHDQHAVPSHLGLFDTVGGEVGVPLAVNEIAETIFTFLEGRDGLPPA